MGGIGAIVVGALATLLGSLWAHFTHMDVLDQFGRELYPAIPRGWAWRLLGQIVALGGVLMIMGGITLAYLWERELTWARAAVGATLFSALMMIVFGVIPNEWLTLTQSDFAWTPQKIAFTIPRWLVLNNDVSISYAAVKDIVSGTYSIVALVATGVGMSRYQRWRDERASAPPPKPVSPYGRPVVVADAEVS